MSSPSADHAEPDPPATGASFSVREARQIIIDLFQPSAAIYWSDLLCSTALFYVSLATVYLVPLANPWHWVALVAAVLLGYRLVSFTHELVHLRRGTFDKFRAAWNLLCGIPLLVPSFMYHTHLDHHGRTSYGTAHDGEYLPLAHRSPWLIVAFVLQAIYIPALAILRFLVLAPLSWSSPRLRRLVHQRASSLVIDASYVRPLPTHKELRLWHVQETACFLVALGALVLWLSGRVPTQFFVELYLVAMVAMVFNQVRTLGAHRFLYQGEQVTFLQQLLDSVNYPHAGWWGACWAPVGLRYHALHHLFPSLPYHNLGVAHRRLMAELPADSPYRQTVATSLPRMIGELWQKARQNRQHPQGTGIQQLTEAR